MASYGGAQGLAALLGSSSTGGVDPTASGQLSLDSRREVYGPNRFKERTTKPFLRMVFDNLKDPTLILLMAAALVRIIAVVNEFSVRIWLGSRTGELSVQCT